MVMEGQETPTVSGYRVTEGPGCHAGGVDETVPLPRARSVYRSDVIRGVHVVLLVALLLQSFDRESRTTNAFFHLGCAVWHSQPAASCPLGPLTAMLQPCMQILSPCVHRRGLPLGAAAHGCFADDCCQAWHLRATSHHPLPGSSVHPHPPCTMHHAPCTRLLACTNALTNTHVCACTRAGCKAWRTLIAPQSGVATSTFGTAGGGGQARDVLVSCPPNAPCHLAVWWCDCMLRIVRAWLCVRLCVWVCGSARGSVRGCVCIHTPLQTLKSTVALTPVRRGRRTGRTGVPT